MMVHNDELFSTIFAIIQMSDVHEKCAAMHHLYANWETLALNHDSPVRTIEAPGYPDKLQLVMPRELKRRGITSQAGRNTLMHAIAHIEFNAINLALDAAYRFRHQPNKYYQDWLKVADDEARHFELLLDYLNKHNCDYGDLPAHNGLWDMALKTQHDIVARMALVPRVMEARGLDVTPAMIERLESVNDTDAVERLQVIYNDEIEHVNIGSHWFFHHCQERNLEPRDTFLELVKTHLHGQLRGPFNVPARLMAGFDEMEMAYLNENFA